MSDLKHIHAKIECFGFDTEDVRLVITERYGKQEIRMHGEDAKFIVEAIADAKRRTQPEATAPVQDLSAAILDMEVIGVLIEKVRGQFGAAMDSAYCPSSDAFKASRKEFCRAVDSLEKVLSLASSANALSAGDRVDAALEEAAHLTETQIGDFTIGERQVLKGAAAAIRQLKSAAILQSQKGVQNEAS